MEGAEFNSANLHQAQFSAAVVDGAQFTGADLSSANFDLARASGANFDLTDVRNIDRYPLDERAYNALRTDIYSFAKGGSTLFQMVGDLLGDAARGSGEASILTEGNFKLCDVELINEREITCVATDQISQYADGLLMNACDSEVELRGLMRRVFLWRDTEQLQQRRHTPAERGTLLEGGLGPILASRLLASDCPGANTISAREREDLSEIAEQRASP